MSMIRVEGSVRRSFVFPAPRREAFNYYSNFPRVVKHLPLISLSRQYGDDQFRVVYRSTELGVYTVKIYCDVATALDGENWVLVVKTTNQHTAIRPKSSWRSTAAQGVFASQSAFYDQGEQTLIEYKLHLLAQLPAPFGLRVIPGQVLSQIAENITLWRMDDIIDDFVRNSIQGYRMNGSLKP